MSNDQKPSNPKDAFGSAKAPLGLVPDTGDADVAMAFLEGALKYGRFNWRVAGVRASIYNDAIRRHLKKWWNGENRDPLTRVKHLANLRACVDILLDAELCGMLEDDRPPALVPLSDYIDSLQPHIAHLKQLFKDHSPPQYTQKSHPRTQTSVPPGMTYAEAFVVDEPVKVPAGTGWLIPPATMYSETVERTHCGEVLERPSRFGGSTERVSCSLSYGHQGSHIAYFCHRTHDSGSFLANWTTGEPKER